MQLELLNEQGQATSKVDAPDTVFARDYNEALVHQILQKFPDEPLAHEVQRKLREEPQCERDRSPLLSVHRLSLQSRRFRGPCRYHGCFFRPAASATLNRVAFSAQAMFIRGSIPMTSPSTSTSS